MLPAAALVFLGVLKDVCDTVAYVVLCTWLDVLHIYLGIVSA